MVLAFLLCLATSSSALADERTSAEHTRLSGEIDQLAERQLWLGVDKKFLELEKLGLEPSYADFLHAAHAARALGNMAEAYARLKRAARIDSTKEVIDWLYAIDMNFGSVELATSPPRADTLTISDIPFDPDQRLAVEKAQTLVGQKGQFRGLLPRGSYVFAGQPFTVQPGLAVRIEVSPRMKKTSGLIVNVQTTPTWGSGAEPSSEPATPAPDSPAPEPAPQ